MPVYTDVVFVAAWRSMALPAGAWASTSAMATRRRARPSPSGSAHSS